MQGFLWKDHGIWEQKYFSSSFPIWINFISFSCLCFCLFLYLFFFFFLIALPRTSGYVKLLNRSGKTRYPFFVLGLREKGLFLLIHCDASCGLFTYGLYYVEVIFSIPSCWVFIMKVCWALSNVFDISLVGMVEFLPSIL
jgi:hypothetical protein